MGRKTRRNDSYIHSGKPKGKQERGTFYRTHQQHTDKWSHLNYHFQDTAAAKLWMTTMPAGQDFCIRLWPHTMTSTWFGPWGALRHTDTKIYFRVGVRYRLVRLKSWGEVTLNAETAFKCNLEVVSLLTVLFALRRFRLLANYRIIVSNELLQCWRQKLCYW